jgi:transmembrane sensor
MQNERFTYLFDHYFLKTGSGSERSEFLYLLSSGNYDSLLKDLIDRKYDAFLPENNPFSQQMEEAMLLHILQSQKPLSAEPTLIVKQQKLWPRIIGVAAAFVAVVFGIYFFTLQHKVSRSVGVEFVKDVDPGNFGATLTLANGDKIRLNDAANGQILKDQNINIIKKADGQLVYEIKEDNDVSKGENTLTTAKGETYMVVLPDHSKVWLNAQSSLTFATGMVNNGSRKVKLEGEAYFEVARLTVAGNAANPLKVPFVVSTDRQDVEVLGTHFNISSYKDEASVKTTLLEGKVKVLVHPDGANATGKSALLSPGQEATLDGKEIAVKDVDVSNAVAWKNGEFMFDNERLETIMKQIARWYNVEIRYEDPELKIQELKGGFTRFEKVSKVLTMLERTGRVNFEIKGNTIIIKK